MQMPTTPTTVRLTDETRTSLEAMAKAENSSVSQLLVNAAEQIVAEKKAEEEMVRIAFEEADREGWIPGDEVMAWFDSLGTENELPEPQPRAPQAVKHAA